MQLKSTTEDLKIVVITMDGRLDALAASPLRDLLQGHIDAGEVRIIVDLSEVEFVDSAGLAALVNAMKKSREQGGDLRLVSPKAADAQRVFDLTRFDKVFRMEPDLGTLRGAW